MNNMISLILKERRVFFSGIAASIILFGLYIAFLYYPLFRVEERLFIRNIPKSDVVTQYGETVAIQSESGFSNPLFNLVQILDSQEIKSRTYNIVQKLYPEDLQKLRIEDRKAWDKKYSKLVKVKVEPTSDVIKISLDWVNKDHAPSVLNTIVSQFRMINLEIRKLAETKQRSYLDNQMVEISNKLNFVRGQLRNYRLANNAIDLDNERIELTRARIDLERQAAIIKSQVNYNRQKLRNLAAQLNIHDAGAALRATAVGQDPYLIQLSHDLAVAQQNYVRLQAKFTDNYPDVIAAKNEIIMLKRNIRSRVGESLKGVLINRGIYDKPSQDIVTDMARAQAEASALRAQSIAIGQGIANLRTQEFSLPGKFFGISELEKQEAPLVFAYNNVRQKQLEARIKENAVVDNVFSLGLPTFPNFMVSNIIIKLLEFLSLGVLVGLGIAWIKEDVEDKWSDSNEIQEVTKTKVLGIIPWTKDREYISGDFVKDPASIKGIAYSSLASNIILKSCVEDIRTLAFVSTSDSRDDSVMISNISAAFARQNRSIVLIDIDFSNPSRLLKSLDVELVETRKDLLDVINEINKYLRINKSIDDEYIGKIIMDSLIPITIKNQEQNVGFYYLCTNKPVNNIHDYIATKGFTEILDFLKHNYEFILIDTPAKPIIFPEFNTITSISDAVVIISSIETNRRDLVKITEKFKNSDIKILGIITREENSELEKHYNTIDQVNKSKIEISMKNRV